MRQHQLNVSGIRVHVRAKAIDGFLLVDLIGSLHLTARLDWEFAQNRSEVLGGEPSPSKLSFLATFSSELVEDPPASQGEGN